MYYMYCLKILKKMVLVIFRRIKYYNFVYELSVYLLRYCNNKDLKNY